CLDCLAGKISLAGSSTCMTCPLGKIVKHDGRRRCYYCPSGKYAPLDTPLPNQCTSCPAGKTKKFVAAVSGCEDCDLGWWADEGSPLGCLRCEPGTFSDGTIACTSCDRGHYTAGFAMTTCYECAVGSYASSVSSSTCRRCEPGVLLSCTFCFYLHANNLGSYSNQTATALCPPCAAGKFSAEYASTTCNDCPGGVATSERHIPNIIASDPQPSAECLPCQQGKFHPITGLTACLSCP
ncbi:hypothetical protein GUITHDRAFT_45932, partial [Guillardia theta CCMP2712]